MENAASNRSHERSAVTVSELIGSTWKSLWSTPVMVWMRQPIRPGSVSGWVESMRKSARSLSRRSISMGPIVVRVRKPLRRAAEPIEPMRSSVAPIHATPKSPAITRPAFEPMRPLRPKAEWIRNPLRGVHTTELVDLARRHECPRCHGCKFRRSRPRSVEWVLSLVRVVPYRCYSCNWRFFGLSLERDPAGRERETGTSLWYNH
jgi:hypothetical protein